jgi:hypothetical protein
MQLRWKVWLMNEAQQEAGGIYLFDNKAAAEAYLNISAKLFDVMPDHSAITRGPLAASPQDRMAASL